MIDSVIDEVASADDQGPRTKLQRLLEILTTAHEKPTIGVAVDLAIRGWGPARRAKGWNHARWICATGASRTLSGTDRA